MVLPDTPCKSLFPDGPTATNNSWSLAKCLVWLVLSASAVYVCGIPWYLAISESSYFINELRFNSRRVCVWWVGNHLFLKLANVSGTRLGLWLEVPFPYCHETFWVFQFRQFRTQCKVRMSGEGHFPFSDIHFSQNGLVSGLAIGGSSCRLGWLESGVSFPKSLTFCEIEHCCL